MSTSDLRREKVGCRPKVPGVAVKCNYSQGGPNSVDAADAVQLRYRVMSGDA
jgi:hypothetical protein